MCKKKNTPKQMCSSKIKHLQKYNYILKHKFFYGFHELVFSI
jgi:hypothetical protein